MTLNAFFWWKTTRRMSSSTLAALGQHHLANEVVVLRDGSQVLDYLRREGEKIARKVCRGSFFWTSRCPK